MSKRILVIDDDDGIREIIQFSLETVAGWSVMTAASGEAGLANLAECPDAILLDVMMPDTDGLTTLEYLRSRETTAPIPVILLTAKTQTLDPQRLERLQVAGVITKPFKAQKLVAQIREILQWSS